jgi:TolA-binding protein
MKLILTLLCLFGTALQLAAAESPSTVASSGAAPLPGRGTRRPLSRIMEPPKVVTTEDLNQLRERIAKQEEEIKRLQQSIEEQRSLLEQAVQNSSGGPALTSASASPADGPVKLVSVANVAHPNIGA